jgi:hypothetical protein
MVKMSQEVVAVTNDGSTIVNAMLGVVVSGLGKDPYSRVMAVVMMFAIIALWEFINRVCRCRGWCRCRDRPAAKKNSAMEEEETVASLALALAGSAGSEGSVGDGGEEEEVMKIWVSPAGDKFHWNRDCRGLAGVAHESRKGRTECLYCFRSRMANKEKAE